MPHMLRIVVQANELLADPRSLAKASRALRDADSLGAALDTLGLFDAVADEHRDGAREAVEALPDSVGRALVAAVGSGIDRGIPVIIQWKPGAAVELQVWEAVEDGAGSIGVLVVTPRGRDLPAYGAGP